MFKSELKCAKENFIRILDEEEEEKRVKQLIDKENERKLQKEREERTIPICPLCLDEMKPMRMISHDIIQYVCIVRWLKGQGIKSDETTPNCGLDSSLILLLLCSKSFPSKDEKHGEQ